MRKLALRAALVFLAAAASIAAASDERLIYETESLYHHIVVSENDDVRILRFHKGPAAEALGSDFAQSVISLADPYSLHMQYAKHSMVGAALVESPKRALFIGLGAGTVPKFFARAFPECQVDVAELDAKVVNVARKYFFFPDLANLKVTVMDGRQFVRQSKDKYNLVMVDAYRDEMIPFHLMTFDFLEQVKAKLAPGGVLISNIAIRNDAELYPWALRTYQAAFPTLFEANVPGTINRVLLGFAEKQKLAPHDIELAARGLAGRVSFDYDLVRCAGVYRDVSMARPSKNILTDDYAPVNLMRLRKADEKDWKY